MSKVSVESCYGSAGTFRRRRVSRGKLKTFCRRVPPVATLPTSPLMPLLPHDTEPLDSQVAGHMFGPGNVLGMMRQNGRVLKPLNHKITGERERQFYEELTSSNDPVVREMSHLCAGYHGVRQVEVNGQPLDCLVLDDLTTGLVRPCVMDVKIGRRTWDPLATPTKIQNERVKYFASKRDVGFCIPGYQVTNISDGKLYKFGRDYGKTLDGEGIRKVLRQFLNGENGFYRPLLVQLLGLLWRILNWCRTQRKLHIYSSSILLVYDARQLRYHTKNKTNKTTDILTRYKLHRPLSLSINHSQNEEIKITSPGFSGQFTSEGPKFERSLSANNAELSSPINVNSTWKKTLKKLQRTHSFNNNYEVELKNLKKNYVYMLDDLVGENSDVWADVKMIDFGHVFPAEGNMLDRNYLEGIENLVLILESFLQECT